MTSTIEVPQTASEATEATRTLLRTFLRFPNNLSSDKKFQLLARPKTIFGSNLWAA